MLGPDEGDGRPGEGGLVAGAAGGGPDALLGERGGEQRVAGGVIDGLAWARRDGAIAGAVAVGAGMLLGAAGAVAAQALEDGGLGGGGGVDAAVAVGFSSVGGASVAEPPSEEEDGDSEFFARSSVNAVAWMVWW